MSWFLFSAVIRRISRLELGGKSENYEAVMPVGDYVVTMCMSDSMKDGKASYTREKLQNLIEKLDLEKLK